MLLEKVTNRLKGQVRICVTAAFPERVLNLCGARNLVLWDVTWISPTEFECTLSRQDYAVLRRAAEKLDCTISARTRAGVPFLLGRLRRRQVLAAGACVCALLVFVSSFFIWDFEITGNRTVPDEEILRALEKNGVGLGTFCLSVDQAELRNHVLLDLPKLNWIAVNVSGCRAQVQVRERVPKPELINRQIPSNVVARRDGLVTRVEALLTLSAKGENIDAQNVRISSSVRYILKLVREGRETKIGELAGTWCASRPRASP
jgi:similar to stage IV sporulation protein